MSDELSLSKAARLGVPLQGTTLATLIAVALLARDAFQSQLDAQQRLAEAVVELRAEVQGTRTELGQLRTRVEAAEAVATGIERIERELERHRARIEQVNRCARDRRECQ